MIKKIQESHTLQCALAVLFGTLIGGFDIVCVMIPNGLTYGGIAGLSRLFNTLYGWNYSLVYYILGFIILISVWVGLGWQEVKKIIVMSIAYPTAVVFWELFDISFLQTKDPVLGAVLVGVLFGVSNGMLFFTGFSSGGTDSFAKVLRNRLFQHLTISKLLFAIDFCIVCASAIVYSTNVAVYALCSMFIAMKSTDMFIHGISSKVVLVTAIPTDMEALRKFVIEDLNRTMSISDVEGGYTGETRKQATLYCNPRECIRVKKFLAEHDSTAFVSVVRVQSLWGTGEGFSDIHNIEEE